ncbi:MAG: NERD domain-containing protein [Aquihabitans sp.]
MGVLVPEDFVLSSLANDAERAVVDSLVRGLSDGWLVLPSVGLRIGGRDRELDVVLIHETYGIVDIEVKGHRVHIAGGQWCHGRHDEPLVPSPPRQAKNNAYALRNHLRTVFPGLDRLEVSWGIAFPHTEVVRGALPPEVTREQVLTRVDLDDAAEAIEVLASQGYTTQVLTRDDIDQIVQVLCPDVEFSWDQGAQMTRTRQRLDDLCASQIQVLQELDVNRRVVALGAAGTGKTRLAVAWALRAYADERRALLTCYNEPLAAHLVDSLPEDPDLCIGPFLRLALQFDGMPEPDPEPLDDLEAAFTWWTDTVPAHLSANWHLITERFDTIVVDEAQDFDPVWIDLLERLLDPSDGRLLLVADPAQVLYPRGFEVQSVDDGWTHCRLVANCRNARGIGQLLRRKLDGAPSPSNGPDETGLRFVTIDTHDGQATTTAAVDTVLQELHDLGRDPAQILVLTCSSDLRDHLRTRLGLRRWEDGGPAVVCENVHRLKGLEADTVVLVADHDGDTADALLYVGISRAVNELVVVGPASVGTRLGLVQH